MSAEERAQGWVAWENSHDRWLLRMTWALVVAGLLWRTLRYLLAMPVWGDEGMLLVNYMTRSYGDIFGPIQNCQVAPLLFHWAEIASIQAFGPSELAVRLPPYLGSCAAVGVFWFLARRSLTPIPGAIAIGTLAVSIWPGSMAGLCKPYAWDLLASVLLLNFWSLQITRRESTWPTWGLALVGPILIWASYPSAFVAGGISLACARMIWLEKRWKLLAPFLLFNVLILCSFGAHYWFVSLKHLSTELGEGETTELGMNRMWGDQFPPSNPLKFLVWLALTAAGEIAAYPTGSQRGGSILTLVLAIWGGRSLWKSGHRDLVVALVGILLVGLVAAMLKKYPFGSCRLNQQAAPVFCLLGAVGLASALTRFANPANARRHLVIVATVLMACAIGGIVRDLVRPARNPEAKWSRESAEELRVKVGHTPIVRLGGCFVPTQEWYLWVNQLWDQTEIPDSDEFWVLICAREPADEETKLLERLSNQYSIVDRWRTHLPLELKGSPEHSGRAYLVRRRNLTE